MLIPARSASGAVAVDLSHDPRQAYRHLAARLGRRCGADPVANRPSGLSPFATTQSELQLS
jgi:hypothetical protein